VKVSEKLLEYIQKIAIETRLDKRLLLGVSPRAMEHLLIASKSFAAIRNRDYVIPDDIKYLARFVLPHRLIIRPEYELDGLKTEEVVEEILERVEVPK
ncbi:MAG: magnesium chelatase, partial [Archaeoglobaceae archaeon]